MDSNQLSAKIYGYQNFGKANFGTKPIMPMFPLLLGQWPPKGLKWRKRLGNPATPSLPQKILPPRVHEAMSTHQQPWRKKESKPILLPQSVHGIDFN